jgi:hypothetical protein
MAGRRNGRRRAKARPGKGFQSWPFPEARSQGQKSLRWSVRKALLFTTQGALFGAPSPLKKGDQLKAQLAQRREEAGAWLFEI